MTGVACPLPDVGATVADIPMWQYRTPAEVLAWCRLRVWKSRSVGHFAVVTEDPGGPGIIADAAVGILTALNASFPSVVVFEHVHGDRSAPSLSHARKERLDRMFLHGHLADWQPVWPLAPSHPSYEAHALWAALYFEQVTGCVPDLPAPLL